MLLLFSLGMEGKKKLLCMKLPFVLTLVRSWFVWQECAEAKQHSASIYVLFFLFVYSKVKSKLWKNLQKCSFTTLIIFGGIQAVC